MWVDARGLPERRAPVAEPNAGVTSRAKIATLITRSRCTAGHRTDCRSVRHPRQQDVYNWNVSGCPPKHGAEPRNRPGERAPGDQCAHEPWELARAFCAGGSKPAGERLEHRQRDPRLLLEHGVEAAAAEPHCQDGAVGL